MFLGPIWYVLEFSILCPYFFLAWWMSLNLVELFFRSMWIWWKKAYRWLEAYNHWLALSPPNMCSMIQAGYAMLFFECLRLELCMIVMETTNTTRRTLEERIKNLKLENCQYDPHFFASQEGNTEGGSFRGGSRRSSCRQTQSPNDVWLLFLFFLQKKRKCSLDNLVVFPMFSSLSFGSYRDFN